MVAGFSEAQTEAANVVGKQADVCPSRTLHRLADAAHRVRAMLHAAETLTEKQALTVQDRMALDGLLLVCRECTDELLLRIEQLAIEPPSGRIPG